MIFPAVKLCSKYWEAWSTYKTVHWAHCSWSVPEQMQVGLQSCSSQDSSVMICKSCNVSSASFWLMTYMLPTFISFFFVFQVQIWYFGKCIFVGDLFSVPSFGCRHKPNVYSLCTPESNILLWLTLGGWNNNHYWYLYGIMLYKCTFMHCPIWV